MGSVEENLAINLKRLRESGGLTLTQLAKLAKIDKGTLNKWENQKQGFRLNNLKTVAAALGCSVKDLTSEPPGAEQTSPSASQAELLGSVVSRLAALDEHELGAILKQIDIYIGARPAAFRKSE